LITGKQLFTVQVAVRFPRRFWASKVDAHCDYFGHIPVDSQTRGLFNMFYDLSSSKLRNDDPKANYVLMSYVCGDNINLVNDMNDKQVVALFIETLKQLFPDEVH
jgi:hypothetical protein